MQPAGSQSFPAFPFNRQISLRPLSGLQLKKNQAEHPHPPIITTQQIWVPRKRRFWGPALAKKSFVPWPMSSSRMLPPIFNYFHLVSSKAHLLNFKENVLLSVLHICLLGTKTPAEVFFSHLKRFNEI